MKETSFASYDPRREYKHNGLADKQSHIAALGLIASEKVTVLIVPGAEQHFNEEKM